MFDQKQNNELVSIVMPSYNVEKYISDSIKSVLNQSYSFFELIIVDDRSSDKTVDIVCSFKDNRIKLFINEYNQGAALSRNRALREAHGKYIAFIDSDDIWCSTKLEEQINFMKANKYFFTYTDYRVIKNDRVDKYIRTGPNIVTYKKIFNYCYFFTSTVIYDREVVGLIQINDIRKHNDYAMWFHVLNKVDAYRYPHANSIYIKHDGSISSASIASLIKHHYILFRVELNKTPVKSFFLTINNLWYGFWKKIKYRKRIEYYSSDNI